MQFGEVGMASGIFPGGIVTQDPADVGEVICGVLIEGVFPSVQKAAVDEKTKVLAEGCEPGRPVVGGEAMGRSEEELFDDVFDHKRSLWS